MTPQHILPFALALATSLPAFAEQSRDLDAHEHGHGTLNLAIEGGTLSVELIAPGFDIVGFEHAATTEADKQAVTDALATLRNTGAILSLPDAAGCKIAKATAELHGEGEDDHHDDGHHDHEEHDEQHHDEDDHHDEEDHAEHSHEASHSEFHVEYELTCANMSELHQIGLPYFDLFKQAEELDVQVVTETGAAGMEATRDNAVLDLKGVLAQ